MQSPGKLLQVGAQLEVVALRVQATPFLRQGLDEGKVLADAIVAPFPFLGQVVFQQNHLLRNLPQVETRIHHRQQGSDRL